MELVKKKEKNIKRADKDISVKQLKMFWAKSPSLVGVKVKSSLIHQPTK